MLKGRCQRILQALQLVEPPVTTHLLASSILCACSLYSSPTPSTRPLQSAVPTLKGFACSFACSPILIQPLARLLARSLAHSLTHSLTHSPPHPPLLHSFTHSLTCRVLSPYLRGGGAKSLDFQSLSQDLIRTSMQIPFSVPPYMSLLARSTATLEGIALMGDPKYQLVSQVYCRQTWSDSCCLYHCLSPLTLCKGWQQASHCV